MPVNIQFSYESDGLLTLKEVSEIISNDIQGEDWISYDEKMVSEDFHYNIANNPHLISLFLLENEDGESEVMLEEKNTENR